MNGGKINLMNTITILIIKILINQALMAESDWK